MNTHKLTSPAKITVLVEQTHLRKVQKLLKSEGKGRSFSQFVRDACTNYIEENYNEKERQQDDVRT